MTRKITLSVNDEVIEIDYFVQSFIDHVVGAMIEALEGTTGITQLEVSINGPEAIVTLNGAKIALNRFVNDLVRNTITGLVSTLKGIGEINTLKLAIVR